MEGEYPDYIDTISNADGKFHFFFTDASNSMVLECFEDGGAVGDLLLGSFKVPMQDLQVMADHSKAPQTTFFG